MQSVSGATSDRSSDSAVPFDDQDLKGRYYYDKFQFTPFDAAEHKALRKAYIEGLVWNLKYYYEGCVSWSWYFPYHYGTYICDRILQAGQLFEYFEYVTSYCLMIPENKLQAP